MQMKESKNAMLKKKQFAKKNKDDKEKIKEKRIQCKKLKQMKKKRIIIRNLSFKISEDELKKIFSKFGEILDVTIPVDKDGKKKGFAFIQFKDTKSQIKAMKEMNFKKIHDRPIAIDFAVDKTTYQSRQNSIKPSVSLNKDDLNDENASSTSDGGSEDEAETHPVKDEKSDDENESPKVKAFLDEFDANELSSESKDSSSESSQEDEGDDKDNDDDDSDHSEIHSPIKREISSTNSIKQLPLKKKYTEDVSEGKTVFIRNISFNIIEEDLKEVVEEYGDIEYCLFCKDPLSQQFKGSAFVKFKEKKCADKLVEESCKEPGILIDNRKLNCTYALSREDLSKQNECHKMKDKRNLSLLKYGMIAYGSKDAEGVSKTDMAKRAQLEVVKKQKLKNVNFFVSDKRLMIHNLPKNITDKDLYSMFKKAGGEGAIVKEARVMKDFKKTDAQGVPVSRGFGFVSFTQHEHALKALQELNNNPKIFTSNMRPIVEFSVENKVALLSQERRKEKMRMKNKKKTEDMTLQSEEQAPSVNAKRKEFNKWEKLFSKKRKTDGQHFQNRKEDKDDKSTLIKTQKSNSKKEKNKRNQPSFSETQNTSPKKKQKKKFKGKTTTLNAEERNNLSILSNKYKEKLLNKY